jgi:hypothetical protein
MSSWTELIQMILPVVFDTAVGRRGNAVLILFVAQHGGTVRC